MMRDDRRPDRDFRRVLFAGLVLAFLLPAITALADKVTLKDGRTYEGVVLDDSEAGVKIKTPKATVTFPRDQVASVEKSGGDVQELEKRLSALDPEKPADYLALARWLRGPGKPVFAELTFKRLCSYVSFKDPNLACEAQVLLGEWEESEGTRRAAATAYVRALMARPGDGDVRSRVERIKGHLVEDARGEMQNLVKTMECLIAEDLASGYERLLKSDMLATAELSKQFLGMTIPEYTKEVRRHYKCRECGGSGEVQCSSCSGDGLITCSACDGSGKKKGFTAGKDKAGIADSVCRSCHGLGSILCGKCKAERKVVLSFVVWDKLRHDDISVMTEAGHEADALRAEIDLGSYTLKGSTLPVAIIACDKPKKGGRCQCGACGGIKWVNPVAPLDKEAIRKYRNEIADILDGKKPYDPVPKPSETYEKSAIADGCYRYKEGKWVR